MSLFVRCNNILANACKIDTIGTICRAEIFATLLTMTHTSSPIHNMTLIISSFNISSNINHNVELKRQEPIRTRPKNLRPKSPRAFAWQAFSPQIQQLSTLPLPPQTHLTIDAFLHTFLGDEWWACWDWPKMDAPRSESVYGGDQDSKRSMSSAALLAISTNSWCRICVRFVSKRESKWSNLHDLTFTDHL